MSTVKTWFVEAKCGRITTYLTGDSKFSLNIANAKMFSTEAEARAEFEDSPHFGNTPERLMHMAGDSWLKRRFPNYTFRAVCLDIDKEDRKHGLFHRRNELPGMVRRRRMRARLFSMPGLRRLARIFGLEA